MLAEASDILAECCVMVVACLAIWSAFSLPAMLHAMLHADLASRGECLKLSGRQLMVRWQHVGELLEVQSSLPGNRLRKQNVYISQPWIKKKHTNSTLCKIITYPFTFYHDSDKINTYCKLLI